MDAEVAPLRVVHVVGGDHRESAALCERHERGDIPRRVGRHEMHELHVEVARSEEPAQAPERPLGPRPETGEYGSARFPARAA